MTVIAVRRYPDRIVMSSDSRWLGGWHEVEDDVKKIYEFDVWCLKGIIGHSGISTDISRFIPKVAHGETMSHYDFLSQFRENLKACWKSIDEDNSWTFGTIFAFEDGSVWMIQHNLEPEQLRKDCTAAWSGRPYALWALFAWSNTEAACQSAVAYTETCGGTIVTVSVPIKTES